MRDSAPADAAFWIFGYGSLIWRPDFAHREQRPGFIRGWVRRFWQGSTDHRGVPGAPGRVATLTQAPNEHCWGMAYRIAGEEREPVLEILDHRERGGFDRHDIAVEFRDRAHPPVRALVYVATEENPNYLGAASISEIAAQVQRSRGPSGANADYVFRLAEALRAMGATDDHVFAIAERLNGVNLSSADACLEGMDSRSDRRR